MAENHVLPGTADDDKYSQPEKPTACIGGQRKGKRVYHNGYGRAAPCITFTGNRQAKKEFAKVKFITLLGKIQNCLVEMFLICYFNASAVKSIK